MNSQAVEKLFGTINLSVLKWNGSFTKADVRTSQGQAVSIETSGGREQILRRLAELDLYVPTKRERNRWKTKLAQSQP